MKKSMREMLNARNAQRAGVMAGGLAAAGIASAAIDITAPLSALTTDGTAAISAVGMVLIGLAATAIVFKWVKAAVFS